MFRLGLIILSLVVSVNASANFGKIIQKINENIANDAMLEELDMLADEIEGHTHKERAMNFAFYQLAYSAKIVKSGNFVKPATVTDNDLLVIINSIAVKIQANSVNKLNKLRIRPRLVLAGRRLEKNQMVEVPNLLGELEISGVDPLNLGATIAGLTAQTALLVTNIGDAPVTGITGLAFEGPFNFYALPFPGFNGTCDSDLNVGESCTITIQFVAPAVPGFYEGQLNLQYADGDEIQVLTKGLQGTSL